MQRLRLKLRTYKRPDGAEALCHVCDPDGVDKASGSLPARDRRRLAPVRELDDDASLQGCLLTQDEVEAGHEDCELCR